eukprot:TRINITY_DN752_c2_g1_i3.p1 TRINITY_DN752_c2_g1~~TRINITY_DN752_c2_g1_i3.p1  ORF type:complete len:103 (-),score=1.25 TRINITY_DN752_c2_g1_i3:164-472(-)
MGTEGKKTVAVVGGGIAGLSAAWLLSREHDYDVTIYERHTTIGMDAQHVVSTLCYVRTMIYMLVNACVQLSGQTPSSSTVPGSLSAFLHPVLRRCRSAIGLS